MEITRDEHYKKFLEHCKKFIDEYFEECICDIQDLTESPLENFFALGWELIKLANFPDLNNYELLPQTKINNEGNIKWGDGEYKYRLDFIIIKESDYTLFTKDLPPERKIAVEIDGLKFHEKTKEKLVYEKRRNRFLLSKGWKIFHFVGSEIYHEPFKCLEEIKEYLLIGEL